MKRKQFLFAIALAFFFSTLGSQNVSAQQSNVSLEETLQWIKDKLLKQSFFSTNYDSGNNWSIRVDSVDLDGCSVTIGLIGTGSVSSRSSYSASLSDIDPLNIKVIRGEGNLRHNYAVQLNTVEKKNRVRFMYRSSTHNVDKVSNQLSIHFQDEEIANRIAKAFAHAIRLCKAKEPF